MMRAILMVPLVGLCMTGAAGSAGAQGARYTTGQATYLQKEDEVTLALVPGGTFDVDSTRHRRGATLTFAPAGKPGAAPTFFLHFWTSEGKTIIAALEVRGGQGGNAYFDKGESGCTLTVTRLDAQGVEGSGSCTGTFEGGGAPVASFRFTAKQ
jgi:hypothetical protein